MGLANRLVAPGEALAAAQALARDLAAFPQACMLADRQSAYRQWDLPLAEALRQEGARGVDVVFKEGLAGAAKFVEGAGRRGASTPPSAPK
jgi:enoyl-CoA hydratase